MGWGVCRCLGAFGTPSGGPNRSLEWIQAQVEGTASMDTAGGEHWEVEMGTLASEGHWADTSSLSLGLVIVENPTCFAAGQ